MGEWAGIGSSEESQCTPRLNALTILEIEEEAEKDEEQEGIRQRISETGNW